MDAPHRTQKNRMKKRKNDDNRFQRSICKSSIYKAQKNIKKEKINRKKDKKRRMDAPHSTQKNRTKKRKNDCCNSNVYKDLERKRNEKRMKKRRRKLHIAHIAHRK